MSNCKAILLIIITACFGGCSAPNYIFNTKDLVSDSIRRNISAIVSPGFNDTTVSYRVFRATISEKLVENNSVAELQLVNELSGKKKIDVAFVNNTNELYFYEFTSQSQERFGLLLSATFDASDHCLGVGPLYIGYVGLGNKGTFKFVAEQEYAIKKKRGDTLLYLRKLQQHPKLVFSYETTFGPAGDQQVRFFEVILHKQNKISGINKSLVFDVEKIFNDPNALKFSLTNKH